MQSQFRDNTFSFYNTGVVSLQASLNALEILYVRDMLCGSYLTVAAIPSFLIIDDVIFNT